MNKVFEKALKNTQCASSSGIRPFKRQSNWLIYGRSQEIDFKQPKLTLVYMRFSSTEAVVPRLTEKKIGKCAL